MEATGILFVIGSAVYGLWNLMLARRALRDAREIRNDILDFRKQLIQLVKMNHK